MSVPLEPEHLAACFGGLLRAERRRRLLTQDALAGRAGLHRTEISLADLAGSLGIAPSTFVDDLDVEWIPAGRRGSGYGPAGFFHTISEEQKA